MIDSAELLHDETMDVWAQDESGRTGNILS